jgi:flagellar hook-basal body complex protein FliE
MAIDSVLPGLPGLPASVTTVAKSAAATGGTFGDSLHNLLTAVDGSTATANDAVTSMLDGSGDVHQAMIALQRAEMALEFTVQVRNKFVQAYQDVMRMSI